MNTICSLEHFDKRSIEHYSFFRTSWQRINWTSFCFHVLLVEMLIPLFPHQTGCGHWPCQHVWKAFLIFLMYLKSALCSVKSRWVFKKWKSSVLASIPYSYSVTSFFFMWYFAKYHGKEKKNAMLFFTLD